MTRFGPTPMGLIARRLDSRIPLEDDAVREILAIPHQLRALKPADYFIREGERPKNSTVVVDGYVYRHKLVQDGGRQIVAVHIPGDFIDLQNILLDAADHNIQALTHATVCQFPHADMLELAFRHPAIGKALWRESLVEASLFREWIANIGRRDARARVAHLLCELAVRREAAELGSRRSFELPMTQEQIGDALALTAVHVNRTLRVLEADGLIRRSKRAVIVGDWAALRAAADFNENYLHVKEMAEPVELAGDMRVAAGG
ncbi:Crp/Fnr family transcriptional regulator [Hephaestia mangrovi]|uniref:Crp/Fnr family transcriptional regulator n=1 Tax=Hephaestia mangrovi TaxID=2873268 RepID=UPI0021074905|nr:Crp/Fnr family transcriptional regulator [Hephaestia mangrovi]